MFIHKIFLLFTLCIFVYVSHCTYFVCNMYIYLHTPMSQDFSLTLARASLRNYLLFVIRDDDVFSSFSPFFHRLLVPLLRSFPNVPPNNESFF